MTSINMDYTEIETMEINKTFWLIAWYNFDSNFMVASFSG